MLFLSLTKVNFINLLKKTVKSANFLRIGENPSTRGPFNHGVSLCVEFLEFEKNVTLLYSVKYSLDFDDKND